MLDAYLTDGVRAVLELVASAVYIPLALCGFVYLVTAIYPWLTMHLAWRTPRRGRFARTPDRFIKQLTSPEGRAGIYEPAPRMRRYLRQYALIKQGGETYIRCHVHEDVRYLRYDVAAFDRRGRLLDVVGVKESIREAGYTAAVRLPTATAYACVTLRRADGMYEDRRTLAGYAYVGMGIFAGLVILTSVLLTWVLHTGLTVILEALIPQMGQMPGLAPSLLWGALAGSACAGLMLLFYYIRTVRVINR